MFSDEELCKVSVLFRAFGNPIRFKIVALVSGTKRPLHIKAVARLLKRDYAAIYRHVKVLEKSGLLGIYEVGRSRVLYPKDEELINLFLGFAKKLAQKNI